MQIGHVIFLHTLSGHFLKSGFIIHEKVVNEKREKEVLPRQKINDKKRSALGYLYPASSLES